MDWRHAAMASGSLRVSMAVSTLTIVWKPANFVLDDGNLTKAVI